MRKYLILFLLLIFFKPSFSQNLIYDGSFEDTLNLWELRGLAGAVSEALPYWFDAVDGFGDYFNIELGKQNMLIGDCQNGVPNYGVPANFFTQMRWPRSGIAYAGISFFWIREFIDDTCVMTEVIGQLLKQKLVAGECYKIKLYIGATFYKTSFAVNAFDVKFTNLPMGSWGWPNENISDTNTYCRCSYTPVTQHNKRDQESKSGLTTQSDKRRYKQE